jgi:aminoglycoside 3-N-acetyltransferase
MSEGATIAASTAPATVESLREDLRALGVTAGLTLLVHSSLSALGWVNSGPEAVIAALEAALGPEGTLVMPAHSSGLSEPSHWQNPPVPPEWWPTIRATMPAYDPTLTVTRGMGAIAECFRKRAGVRRSSHPHHSFAAWGRQAEAATRDHPLVPSLGDGSPLARVYDLDGWVLLLGVGHANNTSLHLAEYRAGLPGARHIQQGAPVRVDGERRWLTFEDLDLNDEDFPALGDAFARETGLERRGPVGTRRERATARLMPQRALVDFGVEWLRENRR